MILNFPHLYIEETESTNLLAQEILSKTNPSNGFTIITDYQTAGKGQYGRTWQSERGKNLLFSVLIQPMHISVDKLFRMHLGCSLAILNSLKIIGLHRAKIKWPNDIYISHRKLAGILIQNQIKSAMVDWSIIGIGINVNQTQLPKNLNATSIQLEMGLEVTRENLLTLIHKSLIHIFNHKHDLWEAYLEEYNSHLYLKDCNVTVTKDHHQIINSIIHSVTRDGKLRVRDTNGGFHEFSFGEIQYAINED